MSDNKWHSPHYAPSKKVRVDLAQSLAKRLPDGHFTISMTGEGNTFFWNVYDENNKVIAQFPGRNPKIKPEDFILLLRTFRTLLDSYKRVVNKVGALQEKVANKERTIYDEDPHGDALMDELLNNIDRRRV